MGFVGYMGKTLLFIIALGLSFLVSIYSGFVITELWTWFAVPLGAVELANRWHALGLVMLVSWPLLSIAIKLEDVKLKEADEARGFIHTMYARLVTGVLTVTVAWGVGWLYHQLMLSNWQPF